MSVFLVFNTECKRLHDLVIKTRGCTFLLVLHAIRNLPHCGNNVPKSLQVFLIQLCLFQRFFISEKDPRACDILNITFTAFFFFFYKELLKHK